MNQHRLKRATRGTRVRRLAISLVVALLATVALVVGCGGGGGGDGGGSTVGPGPSPGAAAGTWFYALPLRAFRYDVSAGTETAVPLAFESGGWLGYGGGMFTDVETRQTGTNPSQITVNLRNVSPNPLSLRGALKTFPLAFTSFVAGPVQPSPNGTMFAMNTTEASSNFIYVFDAALNIIFKLEGYRGPVWLGNDRVVVVSGDSLFTLTVAASPVVTRVGPQGLGRPGIGAGAGLASVSPDGSAIAYVQDDTVWRIGVDGSGLTQLTLPSVSVGWPAWSPDGSQLAVVNGSCPPLGSTAPQPGVVIISATSTKQGIGAAKVVHNNCGPVYWLP